MVIWVHNIFSSRFVFSEFSFNILLVLRDVLKSEGDIPKSRATPELF